MSILLRPGAPAARNVSGCETTQIDNEIDFQHVELFMTVHLPMQRHA